jgi:hypothetical protein
MQQLTDLEKLPWLLTTTLSSISFRFGVDLASLLVFTNVRSLVLDEVLSLWAF